MQELQDISALEEIFRKNYPGLYARAWRFVQDEAAAEEIVQDVFLNLWNKRDEIVIYTSIGAYLHATTVNHALDYLRKKDSAQNWEHLLDNQAAQNKMPEDPATDTADSTGKPLCALPGPARSIFVLNHFENLSYRAIALQLSISVKAVETQMGKAIQLLKSALPAIAICFSLYSFTR